MTTITTNIKRAPGVFKKLTGSFLTPELSSLKLLLCPIQKSQKQSGELFKATIKRWMSVDSRFREWFVSRKNFELGHVKDAMTQTDVWVMLAITHTEDGVFDKAALKTSLEKMLKVANENKASVHISHEILELCDDAEQMFRDVFIANGVSVTVYTPKSAVKKPDQQLQDLIANLEENKEQI